MTATDSLLSALADITGTGDFHSTGTAPFSLPGLEVDGVGEIAFPLPAAQAKQLIAVAEAAPYGKGQKTVHDESVRKCWQLDASQLSIKSAKWKKFLRETVARVREDLGITGKISARPYKLLVYGKGGHFKAHRDTEKLDAMFGTLIIALPSAHEGGKLLIRHDGREIEVDFSKKNHLHDFQHAAFFADCEHEVEPVRSGYRCCLVYNLRLDEGDPASLNLALDAQARTLIDPLLALKNKHRGDLSAVLLDHAYTEANFSLRKLKGDDQTRARALFSAAREVGLTAHLGLVTYHKMGELEDDGYGGGYWEDDDVVDPEDGTMGEVHDESLTIDLWRSERDRSVSLGSYHIEKDRLLTREDFDKEEPDEKEAEGYTGNAGCTMDFWYRRAAIVLWANEDDEEILCRYNFDGACGTLASLVSGGKKRPGPRFHRLAKAVVALLPEKLPTIAHFRYRQPTAENRLSLVLDALARAKNRELLDELLPAIPDDAWLLCGTASWKKLHQAFGVDAFSDVYDRLEQVDPDANRRILFPLLDALLAKKDGAAIARKIAVRLARLKPASSKSQDREWDEPAVPRDRTEVRILLAASRLMDNAAELAAVEAFALADRSLDVVRQVLAPVLVGKPALAKSSSVGAEVMAFCKKSLADEISRPLGPYPDWTRPYPVPPPARSRQQDRRQTAALAELAAFMADPAAKTHEFRYPEYIRGTLESFIAEHALDLDHVTLRKGSPHLLVCTKNDRSHHRALARRAEDEKLLAKLSKI